MFIISNTLYGRFLFGAQKELITHVKDYFRDVSFSKPSPRSKSWENGVPRIGFRIGSPLLKLVSKPSPRSESWEISARRIELRTPPLCELVSTPLYDLNPGKSVVPRIGSRTAYKNVHKRIRPRRLEFEP